MVEISEYKGHKILSLKRDVTARFPFSFGVSKAKLILEHIEEIKLFVAQNPEPDVVSPTKDKPIPQI